MIKKFHPNLWRHTGADVIEAGRLDNPAEVDLAIVGGGFTGCSAALEAVNRGASVILLEAETIGHGGSGRNVGLVNAGLWLPPDDVVSILGEGQGMRLMTALSQAPQTVFDIIARHDIHCEATRNGTLHLAHASSGLANLESRLRQGNRLGAPLQLLDAAETKRRTGSAAFLGSLWDPRAGTIQPLSYCRGLARAAQIKGARLIENARVSAIGNARGRWTLDVAGTVVTARALLVATNAYHRDIKGGFNPGFVPVNYCQFATAPLTADLRARVLPGGEGCWDTALVMSSIRMDQAGRLIIGGIGNSGGVGSPVHQSWARRKLRALYPELAAFPFEHMWHGQIAMTGDHIPKVVAFGPNAFAVYGYSGRGIGPGTVFGRAAAQALLTGDSNVLPLAPIGSRAETFARLRATYYELGAIATHVVSPSPLGRPGRWSD